MVFVKCLKNNMVKPDTKYWDEDICTLSMRLQIQYKIYVPTYNFVSVSYYYHNHVHKYMLITKKSCISFIPIHSHSCSRL